MMCDPRAQQIVWKYEIAEWIRCATWAGLIDHHMRIIMRFVDAAHERWYLVFDTTLSRGYADYEWIPADELERKSMTVQKAPTPEHAFAMLQRAAECRHVKYSIPERLDCESLQRWIHTGLEQYRWCPQVWSGIATVVFAFGYAAVQSYREQQRAERHKRWRRR